MLRLWQFSLKSLLAVGLVASVSAMLLAPHLRSQPAPLVWAATPWLAAFFGTAAGAALAERLAIKSVDRIHATWQAALRTLALVGLSVLLVGRLATLLISSTRVAMSWPALGDPSSIASEAGALAAVIFLASCATAMLVASVFPPPPPIAWLFSATIVCGTSALLQLEPAQPWLPRRLGAQAATWLGTVAGALLATAINLRLRRRTSAGVATRLNDAPITHDSGPATYFTAPKCRTTNSAMNSSFPRCIGWLAAAGAAALFVWLSVRRTPYSVFPTPFAIECALGFVWGLLVAQSFASFRFQPAATSPQP